VERPRHLAMAMELIELHEARRNYLYWDSEDVPTIGIGFNLTRKDAKDILARLGYDIEMVLTNAVTLWDEEVDKLFEITVKEAEEGAEKSLKNYDKLNDARKAAVIDMVFNLGVKGFRKFKDTRKAIENEDWEHIRKYLKDSVWWRQVGRRARNIAKILEEGEIKRIEI